MSLKTLKVEMQADSYNATSSLVFGRLVLKSIVDIIYPKMTNCINFTRINDTDGTFTRVDNTVVKIYKYEWDGAVQLVVGSNDKIMLFVKPQAINYDDATKKYFCEITYYLGEQGFLIVSNTANGGRFTNARAMWSNGGDKSFLRFANTDPYAISIGISSVISGTGVALKHTVPNLGDLKNQEQVSLLPVFHGINQVNGIYKGYFREGALKSTEINIDGKGTFVNIENDFYVKSI